MGTVWQYLHVPTREDGLVSGLGLPPCVRGIPECSLCMCDLEHLTLWMEVVFNAGAPAHLPTCLWLCWCPASHRPQGLFFLSPPPVGVLRGETWEPHGISELLCRLFSLQHPGKLSRKTVWGKWKNVMFVPKPE